MLRIYNYCSISILKLTNVHVSLFVCPVPFVRLSVSVCSFVQPFLLYLWSLWLSTDQNSLKTFPLMQGNHMDLKKSISLKTGGGDSIWTRPNNQTKLDKRTNGTGQTNKRNWTNEQTNTDKQTNRLGQTNRLNCKFPTIWSENCYLVWILMDILSLFEFWRYFCCQKYSPAFGSAWECAQ